MASKVSVWGLAIAVDADRIAIDGLPGVSGSLVATKGGYSYRIDGEEHKGSDAAWDIRTALRYALLSYRNQLNAAIVEAAYPRQRGSQSQRQSRIAELERLQSETNAMLAQLLAQLNKGK
jgi:hypothetical protein